MSYPDPAYEEARRRVKAKKKFHNRLIKFAGVSIFLTALNLVTSPDYFWAIFPILGMGLAVFINWMKVYGPYGSESGWEEKEMEKELRRLESGQGSESMPPIVKEEEEVDELELKELKKEKTWDDRDLV